MARKTLEELEVEKKKEMERRRNYVDFLDNAKSLDLNNREISLFCGVHIRTVERWMATSRAVPRTVVNFLESCLMCRKKYPWAWLMIRDHFLDNDD